MVQLLIWIIIAYAAGALAVHIAYRRLQGTSDSKHYVLYTLNDQRHIEWAVRSLMLFYWLRNKTISITIIDEGSTDDTLAIVRSLSKRHTLDVRYIAGEEYEISVHVSTIPHNETIHIRLRQPEDLQKLPILHAVK
jgi:hypothetical protein